MSRARRGGSSDRTPPPWVGCLSRFPRDRRYLTKTRRSVSIQCLVEPRLGLIEALGVEGLDRVCGARDDPLGVVCGLEVRQDVIGRRAPVSAAGAPNADAQPHEVLRP